MTKSRKVGIILACALIFALLATSIVPFAGIGTDTASAVAVVPHEEWKNAYDGDYYDNLNVSTGTEFRSALAKLITSTHHTNTVYKGTSSLALNNVWPHSDKDMSDINANRMTWFYSGTIVSANSFGGGTSDTNREHVWAKNAGSTFTAEEGPGADAHHLRPTNVQLNSTRSNWGFAEITQTNSNIAKENGRTDYGTFPDGLCYQSGSYFYPAAGFRGATARILMYMQVRYGDEFSLYFVDGTSSSNGKGIGKISDLFKWHLLEPPTTEEIYRNHAIAEIQGNRNPFIDHPEYAELIFCNDGSSYNRTLQNLVSEYGGYLGSGVDPSEIPTSLTLSPSSLALEVGSKSQQIGVTSSPVGTRNDVNWFSDDTSVATVNNGVVTAVSKGTTTITAKSKYDSNVTASLTVTVTPVKLTALNISESTFSLNEGRQKRLTVTPTPSNASAEVNWTSSTPSVATVSDSGYVTAVSAGTATITATSVDFPDISVSATVTVKEAAKPTAIEVTGTPTKTDYVQGDAFDPSGLTVTVTYSDGSTDTYTARDELLENFEWLDGVKKQATLSKGTTTVICKYGELTATVSGISVNSYLEDFLLKMETIDDDYTWEKLTLQEKFEALKQAVSAYNKLSDSEKVQVEGKHATLIAAVREYNDAASAQNAELQNALTVGAGAIVKSITATIAALIAAIAKGLWR